MHSLYPYASILYLYFDPWWCIASHKFMKRKENWTQCRVNFLLSNGIAQKGLRVVTTIVCTPCVIAPIQSHKSHSACLENWWMKKEGKFFFLKEFSVWKFFKFSSVEGKTKNVAMKTGKRMERKNFIGIDRVCAIIQIDWIKGASRMIGSKNKLPNAYTTTENRTDWIEWRNISTFTNSFDPVRTDWTISRYSSRLTLVANVLTVTTKIKNNFSLILFLAVC